VSFTHALCSRCALAVGAEGGGAAAVGGGLGGQRCVASSSTGIEWDTRGRLEPVQELLAFREWAFLLAAGKRGYSYDGAGWLAGRCCRPLALSLCVCVRRVCREPVLPLAAVAKSPILMSIVCLFMSITALPMLLYVSTQPCCCSLKE